jgi:hypothetical protein
VSGAATGIRGGPHERHNRALANAHTVLAMVAALDGDRGANDAHICALDHATAARDVFQLIRIHTNRAAANGEGDCEEPWSSRPRAAPR